MAVEKELEIDIKAARLFNRSGGIATEIMDEFDRAVAMHGGFASLHEAYAVLDEEVDELWETVRLKNDGPQGNRLFMARREAIQVAAIAMKLISQIDEWQDNAVCYTLPYVEYDKNPCCDGCDPCAPGINKCCKHDQY